MKRFVLNSVFCLLLKTTFIFVAIANPVEVTMSSEFTADDTNTPEKDEQLVLKLTYSVVPDPKPTEADLKFGSDISAGFIAPTVRLDDGDDNDPKTFFITWSGDLTGAIGFVGFVLRGYELLTIYTFNPVTYTSYEIPISDFANATPTTLTDGKLVVNSGFMPGLGYMIVVADKTATIPTLPANSPPYEIIKADWSDVSDETKPNLWTLFQGGGTLNLRVNEPGTTNRLGSKRADDTYDDDHGRNQRQVVINEVMWARDDSFIGNSAEIAREQWIELYNRTTSPIAFKAPNEVILATGSDPTYYSDIKFTVNSTSVPGPPAETDRLSNVAEYDLIWNISSKGQHGSSRAPRREFKSMKRVNYTNGWQTEHWSTATDLFLLNYRGTPGKSNQPVTLPTLRTRPPQDNPAINKIIINEIGNFADDTLDWVELRNVTGSAQSLNNWVLSKTTGFGNEDEIVRFPDYSIEPRGVILLVNRHPWQTPHSLGFDIQESARNQAFGAAPHRYLVVDDDNLAIPNDDAWLLILRSNRPWDVRTAKEIEDGAAERSIYESGHRVEDAVGPGALSTNFIKRDIRVTWPDYEKKSDGTPEGDIWETKVFPLNGNLQADADFLQSDRLNEAGKVWARDGAKQGYLKDSWEKAGFTGIGYDRSVQANDQHGGTPGYDNNVTRGKLLQLDGGNLIVSELMLTTADNRSPQWIELFNTSRTRAIDLAADNTDPNTGWQLIIENHDSGSWKENKRHLNITVNLKDLFTYIPPNQTVLIVAYEGRPSERELFPDSRVASIFRTYPNAFSMASRTDLILNAEGGFYMKIVDGDGNLSDEVGNLDGDPPNLRRGIGLDDPYSWQWPTALTQDGYRTSLIRRRDANGQPHTGVPNRNVEGDLTGAVLPMGTKRNRNLQPNYAWVHAVDTEFLRIRTKLWYGERSDFGTPGYIRGRQLPVSLSFFRAAIENGRVVIRWTTESETDNAGFNILRSHRKDGEYKQINTALIQGAGTTGERNTYKWVDLTAKAGVVYYYQIEDVSFGGERQVLTTSRLKGYVSVKNKLTTAWGELKSLR